MEEKLENIKTVKVMANPHNFVREANLKNIRPEYLIEAKHCIGGQSLARMFSGVSSRGKIGCLSSQTIEVWLNTFKYAENNPEIKDSDQYTARRLEPTLEYYDYIELIKKPIDETVIENWKSMSNKSLGNEAQLYGITLGIKNSKSVKTLLQRMLDMAERRCINIWNKKIDVKPKELDYRLMNVPEIRRLLKERNVKNAHITNKDDLVILLNENPTIIPKDKTDYEKLTIKDLKDIAKDLGITNYNKKITKTRLIQLIKDYKVDDKVVLKDENTIMPYNLLLKDGTKFVVPFRKDGMVNATVLCKAGNKKFNDWFRLKNTKELFTLLNIRF